MNKEEVIKTWNQHAPHYDEAYQKHKFYRQMIEKIVALANPNKDDVVLDIGTGTGALAKEIALKAKKVIAIDISEEMLKTAKEKLEKEGITNVEFKIGSFIDPNISEKVDIIVSNLAFEWIPDRDKRTAIDKMHGLLNDSGKVILGERMFVADPQKQPEKLTQAMQDMMSEFLGKPMSKAEMEQEIEKMKAGIDPTMAAKMEEEFRRDHGEIMGRAENLKRLFEERGFVVERVEEITPITGIICARKT
jgi:ubiquinone/menaquinone biosynthesis C-methylase UbiE